MGCFGEKGEGEGGEGDIYQEIGKKDVGENKNISQIRKTQNDAAEFQEEKEK